MIVYRRNIEKQIDYYLKLKKVLIIYGPRQAGKTTFVKKLAEKYNGKYYSCEETDVALALTNKTSAQLKSYFGDAKFIVLDEAQKVRNIGTSLKLLYDNYPEMQIVATGSSVFELANQINEPLTGRNLQFYMYPISVGEFVETHDEIYTRRLLDPFLVFGMYPGVIDAGPHRKVLLEKITNDYLYKDILSYQGIKKPYLLQGILKALAHQVGSQVSYSEIGQKLGVSGHTISHYVDILEQAFIVFRLHPLTKRKRDEIKFMHKIYFWDNGILNTLRGNLTEAESRGSEELGILFENFVIAEKMKKRKYNDEFNYVYFWRTKHGAEVDFVEEYNSATKYVVYECKYDRDTLRIPSQFMENYKPEKTNVVNKYNFIDVLTDKNTN